MISRLARSFLSTESRRFDAYTYSIRAERMAKQGNTEEAISMLENAVADRKIDQSGYQALFNTAIDICGHGGRFNRAWGLFNDMKKRAVPPSERTAVSLLNALAESVAGQRKRGPVDVEEAWGRAVRIAGVPRTAHVLNGLLKVCSRLGSLEKLQTVFPLDAVPPMADGISFTTVLGLLGRKGMVVEGQGLVQAMRDRGLGVSAKDSDALLLAVKNRLRGLPGTWSPSMRAQMAVHVLGLVSEAEPLPVSTLSLSLEALLMLKASKDACQLLEAKVLPQLGACTHVRRLAGQLDAHTAALALKCFAGAGSVHRTFSVYELLLQKGFRPATEHIDALLLACQVGGVPKRAEAVFSAAFQKKHATLVPSADSLRWLFGCLRGDPEAVQRHSQWVRARHPDLVPQGARRGQ